MEMTAFLIELIKAVPATEENTWAGHDDDMVNSWDLISGDREIQYVLSKCDCLFRNPFNPTQFFNLWFGLCEPMNYEGGGVFGDIDFAGLNAAMPAMITNEYNQKENTVMNNTPATICFGLHCTSPAKHDVEVYLKGDSIRQIVRPDEMLPVGKDGVDWIKITLPLCGNHKNWSKKSSRVDYDRTIEYQRNTSLANFTEGFNNVVKEDTVITTDINHPIILTMEQAKANYAKGFKFLPHGSGFIMVPNSFSKPKEDKPLYQQPTAAHKKIEDRWFETRQEAVNYQISVRGGKVIEGEKGFTVVKLSATRH